MARTIQVIFNEIVATKEADSELNAKLTSTSGSAIWRMWAYVTATAIHTLELLYDQLKVELNDIVDRGVTGNGAWYRDKALAFQLGDTLQVVNYRVFYDPIVEENKIIKRASVKEGGKVITVKVAKEDSSGDPIALTATELEQFRAYMKDVKFAGTQLIGVSLNGDTLQIIADVIYDGLFDPTVIQTNVENAVNTYLRNITFDGFVVTQDLEEEILAVEGVNDLKLERLTGVNGASTFDFYNLATGQNARRYETLSGYISLDTGNSTLTLIAQ